MKFTHVLKFNSVPEWREYYINYPLLKKLILAASTAEAYEAYEGHPPGKALPAPGYYVTVPAKFLCSWSTHVFGNCTGSRRPS